MASTPHFVKIYIEYCTCIYHYVCIYIFTVFEGCSLMASSALSWERKTGHAKKCKRFVVELWFHDANLKVRRKSTSIVCCGILTRCHRLYQSLLKQYSSLEIPMVRHTIPTSTVVSGMGMFFAWGSLYSSLRQSYFVNAGNMISCVLLFMKFCVVSCAFDTLSSLCFLLIFSKLAFAWLHFPNCRGIFRRFTYLWL